MDNFYECLIFSCPNVSFCLFNSSWPEARSSQVGKSVCYLESLPGTAASSPAMGHAVPGAHLRDFGVRTELSSGKKKFHAIYLFNFRHN